MTTIRQIPVDEMTEHDCPGCGQHFSTCICEEPAAQHSPLPWGAFDSSGKLRALFDSESEAHFYVRGRGHMYGGSHRRVEAPEAHAQRLAVQLERLESVSRDTIGADGALIMACDNAREALAQWEKAQK